MFIIKMFKAENEGVEEKEEKSKDISSNPGKMTVCEIVEKDLENFRMMSPIDIIDEDDLILELDTPDFFTHELIWWILLGIFSLKRIHHKSNTNASFLHVLISCVDSRKTSSRIL